MKKILLTILSLISLSAGAAETTPYEKIVGIETREWGMHVQVDFTVGKDIGCEVLPGTTYMLDLHRDFIGGAGNFDLTQSMIMAAFMANKSVSFHLYQCNASTRPYVGYVRVVN